MSAVAVDSLVVWLLVLGVGGWAALAVRHRPVLAAVGFLTVLMLVPAWLTVSIGIGMSLAPTMILGVGIIAALVGRDTMRLVTFDIVLLGFSAVFLLVWMFSLVEANSMYWLIMWWVVPYLTARVLASRGQVQTVYDTVAVVIAVVAVLAVVESVTNHNFFDALLGHGSPWAQLQYRGGRVRVEGAFGHSIALGAVLGMSVPLVWSSRWRPWYRLSVIALVGVAAVLTFSRIAMLTTILALAASFILLPQRMPRRVRWTILVVGGVAAAVLVPTVMRVFDDAGSEATKSSDYRVFLLTLLPRLAVFGQATSTTVQLASIDSEPVLFGVRFGLLPLALMLVCALVGVVMVIRRPNPGLVAAMVMLPGLTSVAFLTQFTAFFWFVLGIGVSALAADRDGRTARGVGPPEAGPGSTETETEAGTGPPETRPPDRLRAVGAGPGPSHRARPVERPG